MSIFKSSESNGGASMTMTGFGVAIVTVIVSLAQAFNLPLTQAEITTIIQQVGIIVSAGTILYGSVRKVVNKLAQRS